MRHCDYCKTNEVNEDSICISAHVITPDGQAVQSHSAVWFVCAACIEQYSQSRVVGVFTKALRMKTGTSGVEAQVFGLAGLDAEPEQIEREILDYHKAGVGRVLRETTQRAQSRRESCETEQDRGAWYLPENSLVGFLL